MTLTSTTRPRESDESIKARHWGEEIAQNLFHGAPERYRQRLRLPQNIEKPRIVARPAEYLR